jgi:RNA polymerase sigma-70 factor (ECF subfamily)
MKSGEADPGSPLRNMTEQLSDRELADLVVLHGDEDAFRVLYRRHTPSVYQFVLRLVGGDVQEAEDVIQETWMRAARGLEGFRWQSALKSWLTGIALNRIRETARKKKRSLVEVDVEWEVPSVASDPGQRIDLDRALELLPPGFRTILVLHDIEGFTHQEIGNRLGITDGTSKSQLHGARRAMRRLLGAGLEMA